MNKKQIFIFVTFLILFDLQMTFKRPFSNDQSERVPLPNLKNKKLHILIPHLLQLSEYN